MAGPRSKRGTVSCWLQRWSAAVVILCAVGINSAQIHPLASVGGGAQAKTRDELDLVGLVYEASSAIETVAQANTFAHAFPHSQFLGYIRLAEMDAQLELGDIPAAQKAAEGVLRVQPDNIHALISLAEIYAGKPVEEGGSTTPVERGLRAKDHVLQALSLLKSMSMPQEARSQEWLQGKKELLAHAQSVLGYLLLKEKNLDEALENLTAASRLDPLGIYFYRCGLAYSLTGQRQRAVDAFEEARRLGPKAVVEYSERSLRQLEVIGPTGSR